MSQRYGMCAKCLTLCDLTRHHIYPKGHFKKQRRPAVCFICDDCHRDLEMMVIERTNGGKKDKLVYVDILVEFLQGSRV